MLNQFYNVSKLLLLLVHFGIGEKVVSVAIDDRYLIQDFRDYISISMSKIVPFQFNALRR